MTAGGVGRSRDLVSFLPPRGTADPAQLPRESSPIHSKSWEVFLKLRHRNPWPRGWWRKELVELQNDPWGPFPAPLSAALMHPLLSYPL